MIRSSLTLSIESPWEIFRRKELGTVDSDFKICKDLFFAPTQKGPDFGARRDKYARRFEKFLDKIFSDCIDPEASKQNVRNHFVTNYYIRDTDKWMRVAQTIHEELVEHDGSGGANLYNYRKGRK